MAPVESYSQTKASLSVMRLSAPCSCLPGIATAEMHQKSRQPHTTQSDWAVRQEWSRANFRASQGTTWRRGKARYSRSILTARRYGKVATVPGDFNFCDVIASNFYGVLLLTAPFCMNAHDVTCPGGIFFVDPTTGVFGQSASLSFVGGLQTDANDNVYLTFEGGATLSFLPDFITITNIFPLDGVTNSIVGTGSLSNHI